MIAQALAGRPSLLLADEPTASLDSTTQAELRALLRSLQARFGPGRADGEPRPRRALRARAPGARHVRGPVSSRAGRRPRCSPIRCIPTRAGWPAPIRARPRRAPPSLPLGAPIPGSPPDPARLDRGCAFEPRCARPPARLRRDRRPRRRGPRTAATSAASFMEDSAPLVRIRGLTRTYVRRRGPARTRRVEALAGVDLDIPRGSIVALVGQSGVRQVDAGAVPGPARGARPAARSGSTAKTCSRCRRAAGASSASSVQLIFQDAAGALSPRLTAAEIVAEPLDILGRGRRRERRERALELMESVGLGARTGRAGAPSTSAAGSGSGSPSPAPWPWPRAC